MRDHYLDYRLRKLLLRRFQPVSIEAVVSWRRSFAMSQFTICLEHVCDVTSAVVNASAMKAVPIVSSTPRMIPNRRFMAATLPGQMPRAWRLNGPRPTVTCSTYVQAFWQPHAASMLGRLSALAFWPLLLPSFWQRAFWKLCWSLQSSL
jgi:hypothetical protein